MWAAVMDLPKHITDAKVIENTSITGEVWLLKVALADEEAKPGMFYQLSPNLGQGLLLRRPISIASVDEKSTTFIYRVVGKGTTAMTKLKAGDEISCLGPLGNGFSLDAKKPLLVGGGMGAAPLLYLAEYYNGQADLLVGGRNDRELFWNKLYEGKAKNIFVTTDDGSLGKKGFTVDLLPELLENGDYDLVITCGPEIMMRGIYKVAKEYGVKCQVSLEKRMACGLGACLSCAIDTVNGRKKVCKDGPVFFAEEVLL